MSDFSSVLLLLPICPLAARSNCMSPVLFKYDKKKKKKKPDHTRTSSL